MRAPSKERMKGSADGECRRVALPGRMGKMHVLRSTLAGVHASMSHVACLDVCCSRCACVYVYLGQYQLSKLEPFLAWLAGDLWR